jgi:hypothetical protein
MSNLKLKETNLYNMKTGNIGYKTYANVDDRYVNVFHHNNVIAVLDRQTDTLSVSGSGWNSQTTANRLSQFIRATLNRNVHVSSRDNKREYGLILTLEDGNALDIQSTVVHLSKD